MIASSEEDLAELRRSVARFLTDRHEIAPAPRSADPLQEAVLWTEFFHNFDPLRMSVPETLGGFGYSFDTQAVICEQLGRVLAPIPYLATLMACEALAACGKDGAAPFLSALMSGERRGALVLGAGTDPIVPSAFTIEARAGEGAKWRLTGAAPAVLGGDTADIVILPALADGEVALFVADMPGSAMDSQRLETVDLTRGTATIRFDGAAAVRLSPAAGSLHAIGTAIRSAGLAVAAECVGAAERCTDMSVQYAKDRQQFGRPIGAYQAIKHKCADMYRRLELARAAVYDAAPLLRSDDPDARAAVAAATLYALDAYDWIATETIQVHGGIGFAWEHEAHLHYRRAASAEWLVGGRAHHRDLLLAAIDG